MSVVLCLIGLFFSTMPGYIEMRLRKQLPANTVLQLGGGGSLLATAGAAILLTVLGSVVLTTVRWQSFYLASACSVIVLINLQQQSTKPKWQHFFSQMKTLSVLIVFVVALYEGVLPVLMPGVTVAIVYTYRMASFASQLIKANHEISILSDRLSSMRETLNHAHIQQESQNVLRDKYLKAG